MNKVFLYAAKDSEAYRQIEQHMVNLFPNGKLVILPPGSQFTSPLCLQLRSNDPFILFAENDKELNELISLRDEYESFKIILVMKHEYQTTNDKFMCLTPRFIAYSDNNLNNLSEYLINMPNKA